MKTPIFTRAVLSVFSLVLLASVSQAATVLIDLGVDSVANRTTTDAQNRSWNNAVPTTSMLALVDSTNAATGISLAITSPTGLMKFADANQNGDNPAKGAAAARGYPTTATQDSLYGYTTSSGGFTVPTGPVTLTLAGFAAGQRYDFYGFATRNSNDNRSENLLFQGAGSAVNVVYDPGLNTTGNVFASGDIVASSTGQITLTLSPVAGTNVSPNQFFYLGVLEIVAVPEPASFSLLAFGVGAGALGFFRRRRVW